MARYAAETKINELKCILSKGLRMLFFLSLPVAIFLGFLGEPIVKFIFERGAFEASDTLAVYNAFSLYIMAVPAMVIGTVLGQGYYVLKDTKTVAIIGVVEMVFYIYLCYALLKYLGYLAIPAAFVIQFNLGALFSGLILRYKLGNKGGITILLSMAKHIIAALVPLSVVLVFCRCTTANSIMIPVLIALCFITYILISRFVFVTDESVSICGKMINTLIRIK
jgi:putative peptidoglycan lipid II flippase